MRAAAATLLLMLAMVTSGRAQTSAIPDSASTTGSLRGQAPLVYLDCGSCDFAFVRQEITFVNYVRTPEQAQVHMFITEQWTGSGGVTYTITYTGKQQFAELSDTLTYTSPGTDTYDERRKGLAEIMKVGLVPYVLRTPLAGLLRIEYEDTSPEESAPAHDPWNSWVFSLDSGGSFNSEASKSFYAVNGSVSGRRVTEQWKIDLRLSGDYNEHNFKDDEGNDIRSTSHTGAVNGTLVRSITDHLSVGLFGNVSSVTYRNISRGMGMYPAIEYNLFPYKLSSRKEMTLSYYIGPTYNEYYERTIYDKDRELLFSHSLHANVSIRQPWGFVFAGMSGSHYFHDVSKNSVDFWSNVSFRLMKGLSLRFSGAFEIIHDQLYLAAGDATLEERLLQQQQLATTYQMRGSVGLAYTFGSMYNNIVNTRL